jgi:hypothetical protein
MFERMAQIFVGLVLCITGAGIIDAFHAHGWQREYDVWDSGFLLLVEAYSIVGSLFVLLGLRYALGQRNIIERWISRSLQHLALVVVLLSLAILAAFVVTLR